MPSDRDDLHWSPPPEDTDPVCGKIVSTADAKSCKWGGLVYSFCSSECREMFEASPDMLLTNKDQSND
ncbi:MAG: YHS domain-containing protein [Magnetovibrio sp.]|nr:YHS domain-containing protein [Magnetovibrio sp.]